MMEVRDLPEGDDPVTVDEMTQLLLEALPEGDRAKAHQILADGILTVALGISADEPAPRYLAEDVYDDLAEILADAPPHDRLYALMAEAQVVFVQEQLSSSLILGIARYIKDNPGARDKAGDWLDDEIDAWAAKTRPEIQEEATRRLDELEAWQHHVSDNYPQVWESDRLTYIHAKLTLQGARSGSFETATGSFRDFLLDMGASVDNLAIL